MRGLLLFVLVLTPFGGLAGPGDDHAHDDTPASARPALDVQLRLSVRDPQGTPVAELGDHLSLTLNSPSGMVVTSSPLAEDEPGVYHFDQHLVEPGEYDVRWNLALGEKNLVADFDIVVRQESEDPHGGPSTWLLVLVGVGVLVLGYALGRKSSGPRAASTLLLGSLLLGVSPLARAGGEDDHRHDAPAKGASAPLRIGIGQLGVMSQTKEIEGYRLTLMLRLVQPDPNLVQLTADQRELLGIEVETLARAPFGKGITATGEVQADASRAAKLGAPVSGRVESVSVDVGRQVRKGQVLAVVFSPEAAGAQAELAAARSLALQARANRHRAVSALEIARQNLKRQEEFARTGAFSQPGLAMARREMQEAERELRDAKSALADAVIKHETHERELRRIEELYANKLASLRQLEEARLEDKLDEEALARAETRVESAQKAVDVAREQLTREERIQKEGLYDRRELETATAEVRRAEGELRATEAELRGAEATIAAITAKVSAYGGGWRLPIESPIDGTVVQRNASKGEAVQPGQILFEVLDMSKVWVEIDLFESDIAAVKPDMPVEIRPDSDESLVLRGHIESIGKVLDPDRRTVHARVQVENPDGALRQNEFVQALIITDVAGDSLSVPAAAVQEIGGLKVVFIQTSTGYLRRNVKLGPSANNRFEVLEGLEAGDKVVTQGSYQLRMMAVSQ